MAMNGATHLVVQLGYNLLQTQIIHYVMHIYGLRFLGRATGEKITGQELVASGPFMQNN
jgi:hypothetical protein